MAESGVRLATEQEALAVLRSDGVRQRLAVEPDAIRSGTPYMVNERLLLILMPLDGARVEAHISSGRANWRHLHTDIEYAMQFIRHLGYNEIYTNVPDKLRSTVNLIRKHGFRHVMQVGEEGIYRWA